MSTKSKNFQRVKLLAVLFAATSFVIVCHKTYQRVRNPSTTSFHLASSSLCDDQCHQLRLLFQTDEWLTSGKPRAAVYFLTTASRLSDLENSLSALDKNFNRKFAYPVIIFFEEQDEIVDQERIRSFTEMKLFFQKIRFEIPSFLNQSAIPEFGCLNQFLIGYRHMCRFHAKLAYNQPIMNELEYALRLDDDSLILRPINYDIFVFMRDHRLRYGYVAKHFEAACVDGLWPAADEYIKGEQIVTTFYKKWTRHEIFYNNFELSALELWRSVEYQNYIEFIDRRGGIYFHRWGDAPIKTIAVSMFVRESETYHFADIAYKHQGVETHPIQRDVV